MSAAGGRFEHVDRVREQRRDVDRYRHVDFRVGEHHRQRDGISRYDAPSQSVAATTAAAELHPALRDARRDQGVQAGVCWAVAMAGTGTGTCTGTT